MRLLTAALAFALVSFAPPSFAEVQSVSPSSFVVSAEADVDATPAEAWRALTRIERWWNSDHTYSGDSQRLSLDPRAGGCWCERWGNGQSVEHGRVVLAGRQRRTHLHRRAARLWGEIDHDVPRIG
jgi:hypothetical protein